MFDKLTLERFQKKTGLTDAQVEQVVASVYRFFVPDFSEDSRAKLVRYLTDTAQMIGVLPS